MIEWFREFRRRLGLVPRIAEIERQLAMEHSVRRFAEKQAATLQAQNNGWRQQDVEQRAEIERLIREVGTLERQLKTAGVTPSTYLDDDAGKRTTGQPEPNPEYPAPEHATFRGAMEKKP